MQNSRISAWCLSYQPDYERIRHARNRGRSLVELDKNAFRLWVTITDETNTKVEKAEYHKAAFALLSEIIGNVHPVSNIYVIDARAGTYGYSGVSQEYAFHHAATRR